MFGHKKNIAVAASLLIAFSAQLSIAQPAASNPLVRFNLRTVFGEQKDKIKTNSSHLPLICDAGVASGASNASSAADTHNYESNVDSDLNQKLVDESATGSSVTPSATAASEASDARPNAKSQAETSATSDLNSETNSDHSLAIANTGGKHNLSLPANDFIGNHLLKGNITTSPANSPILHGSVQTLPKGTKVALIAQCYLNSQTSQKGSEVSFRIAQDVKDGDSGRVFLPGDWKAHGFITEVVRPGHNGTPGRVNVTIDRIISPDGQYDLPFECKISTADNKMLATTKLIARDIKLTSMGAAAGAIISVQMTGLGVAVSTHGISVGVGAAAGAAVGITAAMIRKGDIASVYPNDEMRLETAEPISLPGFNLANLPSAEKRKTVEGLRLSIKSFHFGKDTFTFDKKARILFVEMAIVNNSKHLIDKTKLFVVSNKGVRYPVDFRSASHSFQVPPKTEKTGQLAFSVDSQKNKYYLIVVDGKGDEFSRAPIN